MIKDFREKIVLLPEDRVRDRREGFDRSIFYDKRKIIVSIHLKTNFITKEDVNETGKPIAFIANVSSSSSSSSKENKTLLPTQTEHFLFYSVVDQLPILPFDQ